MNTVTVLTNDLVVDRVRLVGPRLFAEIDGQEVEILNAGSGYKITARHGMVIENAEGKEELIESGKIFNLKPRARQKTVNQR
jgi:hypothetical protein